MTHPILPEPDEILIVDDTPANLRLLTQILSEHGYRVRAVTSGARAIESAREAPPDLILLDIRMPEMNGFEVCEQLKAQETTHDIPVIFISALDDIQDKLKAFQTGGLDYITKPFQIEEVLARTTVHLALRRLQRQLLEANRRYARELALAGQIQASFLPRQVPILPGWQIAARLAPSRETSGDFYDLIPLAGEKLGILVADVVDKGAGAALFMALNWGLVRTFLTENPTQPGAVLEQVNQRLLQDTQSSQFVTIFLGVLDIQAGVLSYANAAHCPPLLLRAGQTGLDRLVVTGEPLGIFEDRRYEQETLLFNPDDVLVLYTDGVTEAQDSSFRLFGEQRLHDLIQECVQCSVQEILERILGAAMAFAGKEHLDDDIALIVIKREEC